MLGRESSCTGVCASLQSCSKTHTVCLSKNSYKEEKCQGHIDKLYECCRLFYEQNGDDASTVSCPKPSLLKLKMKQRSS